MKDFFIQCFDELEALTGIRQLYFFQSEADGRKKMEVCIAGMIESCKEFDYIPTEEQQKIIKKMMVSDQDFQALNSRTIFKWLNQHKEYYWRKQHGITEEEYTPCPPDKVDEYANQVFDNLQKIGKRPVINGMKQIREAAGLVASGTPASTPEEISKHDLHIEWIRTCFDPLTGKPNDKWLSEDEFIKLQKP